MTDIVAFLNARLDEDEAGALATTPVPVSGCWKAARDKHAPDDAPLFLVQGEDEYELGSEDYSGNAPVIAYSAEWQDEAEANLRFIARHDPARVLREVAAKREILISYQVVKTKVEDRGEMLDGVKPTDLIASAELGVLKVIVRDLAAVYADHPDYEQSWSVE